MKPSSSGLYSMYTNMYCKAYIHVYTHTLHAYYNAKLKVRLKDFKALSAVTYVHDFTIKLRIFHIHCNLRMLLLDMYYPALPFYRLHARNLEVGGQTTSV